jgi:hypothetical protein
MQGAAQAYILATTWNNAHEIICQKRNLFGSSRGGGEQRRECRDM